MKTKINFKAIAYVLITLILIGSSSGCERQTSITNNLIVQSKQSNSPAVFVADFPMDINVTLQFDDVIGGGQTKVNGNGIMVFQFEPSEDTNFYDINLLSFDLNINPFEIPTAAKTIIKINDISLNSDDFDFESFKGTLNKHNNDVTLNFDFYLDPNKIPMLQELGVYEPIRLTAIEKGKMDPNTGLLETHAEGFILGPGMLSYITVFGGQWGCGIDMTFCVSTSDDPLGEAYQNCPTEVQICQGESAILYWNIGSKVTSASITPDVGSLTSLPSGSIKVSPNSTTKYTLKAEGPECSRSTYVNVIVITEGSKMLISANPVGRCTWYKDIPIQTTSPNIMVTSIKTAPCCWGCGIYWPYNTTKTDKDGYVRVFDVFNYASSPNIMPLVGSWRFYLNPGNQDCIQTSTACFEVTLKCK